MAIILAAAGCLLSSALAQQTISIPKHVFGTGIPWVAAYSPDGKQLATGHETGLYLWDVATGQRSQRFPGPVESMQWTGAIAFSPDGTRLFTRAAIDADKAGGGTHKWVVRIWDLPTMHEVWSRYTDKGDIPDRTSFYPDIGFSPDGSTVFARRHPNAEHVTLWDAATGQVLHLLDGREEISAAIFSPDSATLLTGSRDWTARLWDVRTGEELRVFQGHLDRVESVAFSPDGTRVLTGSLDKTARVWDASDGRLLHTLPHFHQDLRRILVAYSPDGSRIMTIADSGVITARQWDPETGQESLQSEYLGSDLISLAFTDDGTKIAVGMHKESILLDAVTLAEVSRIYAYAPYESPLVSPDHQTYVTRAQESGIRTLHDTHTRQARFELKWPVGVGSLFYFNVSPDGEMLLHCGWGIALYDIGSGDLIRTISPKRLSQATYTVFRGVFSPDSTQVLVLGPGGGSYYAWLYEIATDSFIGPVSTGGPVLSAAFSPDGTHFVIGTDYPATCELWNTDSLQPVQYYPHDPPAPSHLYRITSVDVSPDGKRMLTADNNGWIHYNVLRMWDAQSASLLYATELSSEGGGWYARFSPDGTKVLCYADNFGLGPIKVLNAATGLELWTVPQHLATSSWQATKYWPYGTMILASTKDGLTFWDTTTWQQLDLTVRSWPYSKDFAGVAFSPDGRTLFTAQSDAVAMWDLVPAPELVIAREAGGGLVLTWQNPVLGGAYELEQCADLATGDWTEVPIAEPGRHELAVPAPAAMFYRLKEP